MKNLNTHRAYNSLRSERAKQRLGDDDSLSTPELISQLEGYSQKEMPITVTSARCMTVTKH